MELTIEMTNYPHSPHAAVRTTLDEQFEALGRPTRRRILTALVRANPGDEGELASLDFTGDERPNDALMGLYHTHLPKLDEAEFIDWDPDSETITRGSRFHEIGPLVELLIAHRDELPSDWP